MKAKSLLINLCSLSLLIVFMSSCVEDKVAYVRASYTPEEFEIISSKLNLPIDRDDYSIKLPSHMLRNGAVKPNISDPKATLGRVLFYDVNLSRNNKVSCGSCHHQDKAFADPKRFSEGFDGRLTKRNSLALAATANFESSYGSGSSFNAGNRANFFWDERAHSIAEQSRQSIQDDIEMGMDMNLLVNKLSGIDYYSILFKKAFGTEDVSENRITQALQEFVNSFVSIDSKFDEGFNNSSGASKNFANFSNQENLGKTLFLHNCASCHGRDFSTLEEVAANNGLDIEYEDNGVGAITGLESKNGVFKVPFLRNVALTAPYMHDGRFATLEEVIDHYSEGIQPHPNLDHRLRDFPENPEEPVRMNFSVEEKAAIIAFLNTLTDYSFSYDQRYSDPFLD